MRYVIYFTNGETLTIESEIVDIILKKPDALVHVIKNQYELPIHIFFANNINHISQEIQAASGVSSMPKPSDLREKEKEEKIAQERLKADPKAIIKNVQKKYEE